MTRDEATARLTQVIVDTFDDEDIVYRDDLTARDVDGWDSLSNIRFMVAVEQAFGVRLTVAQWQGMGSVGDLVDLLCAKA